MKKLIGTSMKLPECHLRSRLSELVLDSTGRARVCSAGCLAVECLRPLLGQFAERDAEDGIDCCLRESRDTPTLKSPRAGDDNNAACCILTGTPQCFLRVRPSSLTFQTQLQTVSTSMLSPSPSFTNGGSSVRSLSTCTLPRCQALCPSECLLMMESPLSVTRTGIGASGSDASAIYVGREEEDVDDTDPDDDNANGHHGSCSPGYSAKLASDGGHSSADQDSVRSLSDLQMEKTETARQDEGARLAASNGNERVVEGSGRVRMANSEGDGSVDEEPERSCWRCGKGRGGVKSKTLFFCENCGSIQPVDSTVNYFELFSMEKKFRLDEKELESRYKGLQKRLHPDLFGCGSETEKAHSAEQSAHVVKAYYSLKRALSRAKYLLKLELNSAHKRQGNEKDIKQEEEEEGTVEDQDLLMEVMEFREKVEDANGDDRALRNLAEENKNKLVEAVEAVASALDAGEYSRAKLLIHRWTYYKRIADEIEQQL